METPERRYMLDNDGAEAPDRFAVLARRYDAHTRDCLDRLGLAPGARCLEVGAGAGSVAAWMADRVAPDGSVLATDLKPAPSTTPRANLAVRRHDIVRDPLPEGEFDIAHARLVLMHLPDRLTALANMVRALRPGGGLLVEDFALAHAPVLETPDTESTALFAEVHDAFVRVMAGAGADIRWAERSFAAAREVGLTDLRTSVFTETWRGGGDGIALHRVNTRQLRTELVQGGVAPERLERFWALLDDPAFAVTSYSLVSVWGRKPLRPQLI
ncbi:class I SAM-dependent methyltransferase [Glycomyces harbinensis]|uniref:Methyltransferase domain-containing protein n=1 Tax=Glycomyces harbinensis TaxID=58114 RepID=A0A1G6VYN7_9ACTN|nr:class I SAM-dependent methyltransferase [Glycomyces harbinensis]SDD58820.1 Methyltransferase domain-containing protein [Glycomyces harbinensis]